MTHQCTLQCAVTHTTAASQTVFIVFRRVVQANVPVVYALCCGLLHWPVDMYIAVRDFEVSVLWPPVFLLCATLQSLALCSLNRCYCYMRYRSLLPFAPCFRSDSATILRPFVPVLLPCEKLQSPSPSTVLCGRVCLL